MRFTPTGEQVAIVNAAKNTDDNLMIVAMAGTGKTSTLGLISEVLPCRPTLALAFNVKIKKAMEAIFPAHFTVKTMNGLGHAAWGKAIGKRCGVDPDKIGKILKGILKAEAIRTEEDDFSIALQLVRKARVLGLVPEGTRGTVLVRDDSDGWEQIADACYLDPTEHQVYLARRVLHEAIKQSYQGNIDYDDQIYMSALFGGVFEKFPSLLGDETQDLSPLNHIQIRKSAAGRLIMVGDPRQAIYAFRGADSSSMDTLRGLRDNWQDLPLSTTFRCPKAVVARQQDHAPGYNAAPSNAEGEVFFQPQTPWKLDDLAPNGNAAILCRNNAPLFAAALRLIRRGIGCTLMGSEIGKALITLSKKVLPDDAASAELCMALVNEWRDGEVSKARANEKEERVALITDKAECLIAVMENSSAKTAGEIRRTLMTMFEEKSLRFTLATGHKAKGLEWTTVVHLDPWRIPSKYAKQALADGHPAPMNQELNLRYVVETRTMQKLVLADLETME